MIRILQTMNAQQLFHQTRLMVFALFISINASTQNLVPNPSFEFIENCDELINPELPCLQDWSEYINLDPTNTPDLGYEGAVFFPPSTIEAHEGNQYLNIECSTGNPEYIQVDLIEPLVAGFTYCVSFYASVSIESPEVAPSLGAYFSLNPITDSPFEQGLEAHVQGPITFDPTVWTLISGSYTALGGEDVLILGGFENTGSMPFPYMYIDEVSVIPMPQLVLQNQDLCEGPLLLDAFASGASYLWNTGATTSSITITEPDTYSLVRTLGSCSQEFSVEILACNEDTTESEENEPSDTLINPIDSVASTIESFPFLIPNTFTPNEDGNNDQFYVVGPEVDSFLFQIFNRWGQIVYESNEITSRWIGNNINGDYYLQDGIYIYAMKATIGSHVFEKHGHVLLMR